MTRASFLVSWLLIVGSNQIIGQTAVPSRVGRLSYVEGSGSFQPAGVEEWVPPVINRPVTPGDQLWVDRDSKAEIEIGTAVFRLSQKTAFSFLNLDDSVVHIRLPQGTLEAHIEQLGDGEQLDIDTPSTSLSLLDPGEYRIEVNEGGDATIFTVRSGRGRGASGDFTFAVRAPQAAHISGLDSVSYSLSEVPPRDEFDEWCFKRDHRDNDQNAGALSQEVVGRQDLDPKGWRIDPEYGAAWTPPDVSQDWAPYRDGQWNWIDPWGWTWVDNAPWGFAPFHYGRWIFVNGAWEWVPGPATIPGVYAPALVAWVGAGVSGVAWVPLAPGERYAPAYQASAVYLNRVNATVNGVGRGGNRPIYLNLRFVTAVPRGVFVGSMPVWHAATRVPPVTQNRLTFSVQTKVAPERVSVLGHANGSQGFVRPPNVVLTRTVVARIVPPLAPVPFSVQKPLLARVAGRPLDSVTLSRLRAERKLGVNPFIRVIPSTIGPVNMPRIGRSPDGRQPAVSPIPTSLPTKSDALSRNDPTIASKPMTDEVREREKLSLNSHSQRPTGRNYKPQGGQVGKPHPQKSHQPTRGQSSAKPEHPATGKTSPKK